jgi:hypothetical protein
MWTECQMWNPFDTVFQTGYVICLHSKFSLKRSWNPRYVGIDCGASQSFRLKMNERTSTCAGLTAVVNVMINARGQLPRSIFQVDIREESWIEDRRWCKAFPVNWRLWGMCRPRLQGWRRDETRRDETRNQLEACSKQILLALPRSWIPNIRVSTILPICFVSSILVKFWAASDSRCTLLNSWMGQQLSGRNFVVVFSHSRGCQNYTYG